jgi:hypothetical protein
VLADEAAARDCAWDVLVEHLRGLPERHAGQAISVEVRDEMGPRFRACLTMALEGSLALQAGHLRRVASSLP